MFRLFTHRAAALAFPLTLAICLPPMAVIAFNLHAQSGKANTSAANSGAAKSADSSSAAAKGAARKKAFETDLKRSEDGGSVDHKDNSGGPRKLVISLAAVNIVRSNGRISTPSINAAATNRREPNGRSAIPTWPRSSPAVADLTSLPNRSGR